MPKEEMIRVRCSEKQKADWQLRAEASGAKSLSDWIISKIDSPDVAPQNFAQTGMEAAPPAVIAEAADPNITELEKLVSRKIGHAILCDCSDCERFRDYLNKKVKEAEPAAKKSGSPRKR